MLGLDKGHCDAQAFVAKDLPEPSLPPPHRGGEGAHPSRRRQPKAVFLATQKDGHSCGKTACVVVVFGDDLMCVYGDATTVNAERSH